MVTSYPQVVVVRVPTPWVQSDSDITVLRHLEKMGCRLINRPQAILNCVNKFWTFQELAGHGVPLPDTFSYGKSMPVIYLSYSGDGLWWWCSVVCSNNSTKQFDFINSTLRCLENK